MPDGAYFGYNGGREFKDAKYPNLRSVMAGHTSPMHFMVRSNSGIKSFADLKGKRVALCRSREARAYSCRNLLSKLTDLTKKDYKPLLSEPCRAGRCHPRRDDRHGVAFSQALLTAAALDLCHDPGYHLT